MSEHCGYVVAVEKLRPHTNADRLFWIICTCYLTKK